MVLFKRHAVPGEQGNGKLRKIADLRVEWRAWHMQEPLAVSAGGKATAVPCAALWVGDCVEDGFGPDEREVRGGGQWKGASFGQNARQ